MGKYDQFIAMLASLGEAEVRARLAQGVWANRRKTWAEQWLLAKDVEQDRSSRGASISSAQEANATARASLKVARSAKNAAWVAAFAAVIAAIFAALAYVASKP